MQHEGSGQLALLVVGLLRVVWGAERFVFNHGLAIQIECSSEHKPSRALRLEQWQEALHVA